MGWRLKIFFLILRQNARVHWVCSPHHTSFETDHPTSFWVILPPLPLDTSFHAFLITLLGNMFLKGNVLRLVDYKKTIIGSQGLQKWPPRRSPIWMFWEHHVLHWFQHIYPLFTSSYQVYNFRSKILHIVQLRTLENPGIPWPFLLVCVSMTFIDFFF